MIKIEKFGASWCGPCKILDRTLKSIENRGIEIKVYDVDEDESIAELRGIRNIPVLIFYKDEVEYKRTVGAIPEKQILDIIEEIN